MTDRFDHLDELVHRHFVNLTRKQPFYEKVKNVKADVAAVLV